MREHAEGSPADHWIRSFGCSQRTTCATSGDQPPLTQVSGLNRMAGPHRVRAWVSPLLKVSPHPSKRLSASRGGADIKGLPSQGSRRQHHRDPPRPNSHIHSKAAYPPGKSVQPGQPQRKLQQMNPLGRQGRIREPASGPASESFLIAEPPRAGEPRDAPVSPAKPTLEP